MLLPPIPRRYLLMLSKRTQVAFAFLVETLQHKFAIQMSWQNWLLRKLKKRRGFYVSVGKQTVLPAPNFYGRALN